MPSVHHLVVSIPLHWGAQILALSLIFVYMPFTVIADESYQYTYHLFAAHLLQYTTPCFTLASLTVCSHNSAKFPLVQVLTMLLIDRYTILSVLNLDNVAIYSILSKHMNRISYIHFPIIYFTFVTVPRPILQAWFPMTCIAGTTHYFLFFTLY